LHELQQIGARIAGQGPTLLTEYQPYGVRHFLRKADAEAPSELRARPIPLVDGETLPKSAYADIDDFQPSAVHDYRTLVLRHSAAGSRPPSDYSLVYRGNWYDVWQRKPGAPSVLAHLALGSPIDAAGPANCADVMRLAQQAGPQGHLATVFKYPNVVT